VEQTLDRLAAHLEAHLDLDRILEIAGTRGVAHFSLPRPRQAP